MALVRHEVSRQVVSFCRTAQRVDQEQYPSLGEHLVTTAGRKKNHQYGFAITRSRYWPVKIFVHQKLNLIQKASAQSDGIQFNGPELVTASPDSAGYLDYFLKFESRPDTLIWLIAGKADSLIRQLIGQCKAVLDMVNNHGKRMPLLGKRYNGFN